MHLKPDDDENDGVKDKLASHVKHEEAKATRNYQNTEQYCRFKQAYI